MNSSTPVIRATQALDEVDMVPQAIFGRPLQYFTLDHRNGQDDLDLYDYAAFAMNNEYHFCLRHYRGHPRQTVSIYLEYAIDDTQQLRSIIRAIVDGFRMPTTAVRWQRGDPVQFGSIEPLKGRLREAEARILALKIALTCSGGEASTSYIKEQTPCFIPLTEEDLKPSTTRKGERKWQQVVGNVISHQSQRTSIFTHGWAVRSTDGIRITGTGREYLSDMGFSVPSH